MVTVNLSKFFPLSENKAQTKIGPYVEFKQSLHTFMGRLGSEVYAGPAYRFFSNDILRIGFGTLCYYSFKYLNSWNDDWQLMHLDDWTVNVDVSYQIALKGRRKRTKPVQTQVATPPKTGSDCEPEENPFAPDDYPRGPGM